MPNPKRKPSPKKKQETQSTALVPVAPPSLVRWKERQLSKDKIELLKRTVAKGTDDDQLALFLEVCRGHGLDPFAKQVYCILYNNDESRAGKGPKDMVIVTGIGGYRKMAARDYPDFAGSSEGHFTWTEQKTPGKRRIPETCTVEVYRKNGPTSRATVRWDEFAPYDLTSKKADFWNRMPTTMLEKCAEAKALRKAFPGLGDIFTDVELAQRNDDYTPGGRQIVKADGYSPSGVPITHEARQGSREAAQAVAQRKIAEAKEGKPIEAVIVDVEPVPDAKPLPTRGSLELDMTADPYIIRGDIALLPDKWQEFCHAVWKNDWWTVEPRYAHMVEQLCETENLKLVPLAPKPATAQAKPANPPPRERDGKADAAHKAAGSGASGSQQPFLLSGTIQHFTEKMTKGSASRPSAPMLNVLIKTDSGDRWYSVFDRDLFEPLTRGKGKDGEFFVTNKNDYFNLVGLKRIGNTEYEDGKIPVIQRHREPGGKLF